MDDDGLPLTGLGIDLSQVDAIPTKRTLAFMNHFLSETISFLQKFTVVCEEKLEVLSYRIRRLETCITLLETKLASIPGLENVTVAPKPATSLSADAVSSTPNAVVQSSTPDNAVNSNQEVVTRTLNGETLNNNQELVEKEQEQMQSLDPRYAKYFQMLKMGVPLMALRQKVMLDGLDPTMLENPDNATLVSTASKPADNISANQEKASEDMAGYRNKAAKNSSESDFSSSSSDSDISFDD